MSGKEGSPEKSCAAKRATDKSDSSTPTQSPQKRYKHKRRRRDRANSSSSDGILHEARRDLRHMERLLLHSGKLHIFRAYFNDPSIDFYTRPEGRRRHPAGPRNRQPPDENKAMAVLGVQEDNQGEAVVDNNPFDKPLAVKVDEGPPSVISSRGLSPGSSFATFPPSPPVCSATNFEVVPFEGLPPVRSSPAGAAAAGPCPKLKSTSRSLADHDDFHYMASVSASDSDEPTRPNLDAIRVAERLNQMVVSNPVRLPTPEPMSLSSDPATPQDSD